MTISVRVGCRTTKVPVRVPPLPALERVRVEERRRRAPPHAPAWVETVVGEADRSVQLPLGGRGHGCSPAPHGQNASLGRDWYPGAAQACVEEWMRREP